MQLWTITDAAGKVLQLAFGTDSAAQHPKDAPGSGWQTTWTAKPIPVYPDPDLQVWNGTAWVGVPAKVEAARIAAIKLDAETRKMKFLSSGGAKKTEYADKMREVIAWDTLGNTLAAQLTALLGLSVQVRQLRFAYAYADAAAFGDQPADAIARFRAAIDTSATMVAKISAAEAKACKAIRDATTATAKDAAAAAASTAWPAGS